MEMIKLSLSGSVTWFIVISSVMTTECDQCLCFCKYGGHIYC